MAVTSHTHVLANTSTRRALLWTLAAVSVIALYLTGLTRMGMYSTDEPRYADIGRTMARSGDWITPRLWGSEPFFEKPALLYWMTATGFKLGLGTDLAPRLPVALLSVGFLIFFWWRLSHLFDEAIATHATAVLATTGGWLAYSHVAVTDLPLSALFTAAVLLSLDGHKAPPQRVAAAIALGLAVLAKSIPPLVLFLPVLIADRQNWRRWFASWPIAVFLTIALPWHVIATLRNGPSFPYVLFIEQQFGRFFNNSRQHEQRWWFYIPVFLVLLFPWFVLLPVALRRIKEDPRLRALASIVILGLVFFSASVNKLPGYVLPLVPATCILIAAGLARSPRPERWLIAPIALLGLLPVAAAILPDIAASSLRATPIPWSSGTIWLLAATTVGFVAAFGLRSRAFLLTSLLAVAAFFSLEISVFPALDKAASARPIWSANRPECAPILARGMLYGLYYYSGGKLPDCAIVDKNAVPF